MSFKPSNNPTVEDEPQPTYKSDCALVIDMDEVLFQIAAACEQRGILVTNKSNEATSTFKTRTELKGLLKGLEVPEDFFDIQDTQIAEPIANAIVTLKSKLNNFKKKFNTDKLEFYIGGKGNFRDDLCLPVKYKSNRSNNLRPILLKDLREYAIKYLKAVVVDNVEVDDVVAQRMYEGHIEGKVIIGVSSDKDQAGQGYGWVYNPNKMLEEKNVSGLGELYLDEKGKVRGWGRKFLYFQFGMIGDPVDGYSPRDIYEQLNGKKPTFGENAAYKLLQPCNTDAECLTACRDLYIKWYGNGKVTYTCWKGETHTVDYLGIMQLYLDCARMRRWEGDEVKVVDMFKKLKVETLLDV